MATRAGIEGLTALLETGDPLPVREVRSTAQDVTSVLVRYCDENDMCALVLLIEEPSTTHSIEELIEDLAEEFSLVAEE